MYNSHALSPGMGISPLRLARARRQPASPMLLLIFSILASLFVLTVVEYFAADGLDLIEANATAVAAAWGEEKGNADPERAEAVRAAMAHAWHGYENYAWGADELCPDSKTGKFGVMGGMDGFQGLGASIIDAMSTLSLMGLHEEFERAHAWVAENMTFEPAHPQDVSFFETTIRVLGGLLAAHDLSGHRVFLDKAEDLGSRLLPAFQGSRTGILTNSASLPMTEVMRYDHDVLMAECGTNLIEFGTLAARTGNDSYRSAAESGMRFLHAKHPSTPLLGTSVDRRSGQITDRKRTVGAAVDSYFEYLLKYWILRGKRDNHWRDRWVEAIDAALDELIVRPAHRTFVFTGEVSEPNGTPEPIISHLGCFFPGSVALGVISGAVEGERAARYLQFAEGMAEACYQLYNITKTGLAADQVYVDVRTGKLSVVHPQYLQRPEVVESLFYLYRATHDPKYRDWGWHILGALNEHCKREAGYAGLSNADMESSSDDTQQSWFLAETLKYLYLLFSDDSVVDLNTWVFNTEAHPMRADVPRVKAYWVNWEWLLPKSSKRNAYQIGKLTIS